MTATDNALRGERYLTPYIYPNNPDRLLAAASRQLQDLAAGHALSPAQCDTMAAAMDAAGFLFEIAERIARGEPANPERCSRWMDLACRFASGKLAELCWKHGLPVVPDAAVWRGHVWQDGVNCGDEGEDTAPA